MSDPMVWFLVHTVDDERDGHWAVTAEETGITTYGKTRDEALTENRRANVHLVGRIKKHGLDALALFLTERGIPFRIGDEDQREVKPRVRNDATPWLLNAA